MKPEVTYDNRKKRWILQHEYRCPISGVRIPELFLCDLASIPRIFWNIIAPYELSIAAPLVHDYLYRTLGDRDRRKRMGLKPFTRKECDKFFLQIMKSEGVSFWRRSVSYRAVRIFAGVVWTKRENEQR